MMNINGKREAVRNRTATSAVVSPAGAPTLWVLLLVVVALLAAGGGCRTARDASPTAPTGGMTFVLDYDVFVAEIDSILGDRGCDNTSCHGGGIRGTYQLSPSTDKDVDLDFAQTALQVDAYDPPASPLLMKPLDEQAGGSAHAANAQLHGFASTSDPGYQAILAWIESGEFQ